jgi:hypothetical protein
MFVGHFALGFAAKRAAPRVSLAALCAATQMADLLWPVFLAVGIEYVRIDPGNTAVTPLDFVSYPYSHSLLFLAIWGVAYALPFRPKVRLKADAPYRQRGPRGASGFSRTSALLWALVVSHWLLDWITHRPDMPLYAGGTKYGLGLWNSVPATLAVELPMYAAGLWIYARTTRARDAQGRWGFWTLAAFLAVVYVGNIFGPPPPSVFAIWTAGLAGGAILLAWIWWVDRHRDVILATRPAQARHGRMSEGGTD